MIINGKLKTDDGIQVACFPSQEINITQGANAPYSHLGTKNTDNACISSKRDIYAPCDMVVSRNLTSGGFGIVIFHTLEPVLIADGIVSHFTMVCMHDNNSALYPVGNIYRQGVKLYREGNADPSGLTTGIHVHYELALGHETERVLGSGGRYHIKNPVYIDQIFFKNLTVVRSENASGSWAGDRVFSFKEYNGGITPNPPSNQNSIYHLMISKAFPFIL